MQIARCACLARFNDLPICLVRLKGQHIMAKADDFRMISNLKLVLS